MSCCKYSLRAWSKASCSVFGSLSSLGDPSCIGSSVNSNTWPDNISLIQLSLVSLSQLSICKVSLPPKKLLSVFLKPSTTLWIAEKVLWEAEKVLTLANFCPCCCCWTFSCGLKKASSSCWNSSYARCSASWVRFDSFGIANSFLSVWRERSCKNYPDI